MLASLSHQRKGPPGGAFMLLNPDGALGSMKALIGLKRRLCEHQGDRQNYALARAVGDTPFEGVIKSARFVGTQQFLDEKPAAGRLQRDPIALGATCSLSSPQSLPLGACSATPGCRLSRLSPTSPAKPAAGRLQRDL